HIPDNVCLISAATGQGVDQLIEMITETLSRNHKTETISLPLSDGKRVAWLHENGRVIESGQSDGNLILTVQMSNRNWGRFHAQ
ncbi:MAG: GTPase HflX, partial [Parasphingorhabdus sp.]